MTFFAYPKELERLPSHLPLSSAGWSVECIPNRASSLADFFLHGDFLLFRKRTLIVRIHRSTTAGSRFRRKNGSGWSPLP